MQLVIKGETELYRRLDKLNDVMKRTFWIGVQEDLEDNLLRNIKPHTKPGGSGNLERNAYVDLMPQGGVEAGIQNQGMMVGSGNKINYAVFVHNGTKKHDVSPKNKKALRWNGPGGYWFSKGH